MRSFSHWPTGRVALVAVAWPAVILLVTVALTAANAEYVRAPDGTIIWSVLINDWPSWIYWLAFAPSVILVLWRANRPG
jgi:hypothetical protein